MSSIQSTNHRVRESLDGLLLHWLKYESHWSQPWQDWCKHAMLGAGKALRPALVFDFYRTLRNEDQQRPSESVLRIGLAIELLHTFTLVHDDLPCMDDDDFRRGRLTLHRLAGEAEAVLLGDALHAAAFQVLATNSAISAEDRLWMVERLARGVGGGGVMEGQRLDLSGQTSALDELRQMHALKTGVLFSICCEFGAVAACGSRSPKVAVAAKWGSHYGYLFQVADDWIDRHSTFADLGKTPGKDERDGKKTIFEFVEEGELQKFFESEIQLLNSLARDVDSLGILKHRVAELSARIHSAGKK